MQTRKSSVIRHPNPICRASGSERLEDALDRPSINVVGPHKVLRQFVIEQFVKRPFRDYPTLLRTGGDLSIGDPPPHGMDAMCLPAQDVEDFAPSWADRGPVE